MKESKVLIIVSSLVLVICFPVLIYSYFGNELIFNITISIVTGLIVSIITAICQYFVIKGRIKNDIFNCYFDLYKAIYVSEKHFFLFHYNVSNLYKKFIVFSDNLSKSIAEYSGFIPNKKNRLYQKLNPEFSFDCEKINGKNIIMLALPFNSKKFKEVVIPFKIKLEDILVKLDRKKFEKEFQSYRRMYRLL